jgi:hypothetical protein
VIRRGRTTSRGRHPSFHPAPSVRFAHPSEESFARLLSLAGHEWRYEPEEFPLEVDGSGTTKSAFRPDFYLPAFNCFIELTVLSQPLVTKKNRKIRLFRERYPDIPLEVVYRKDFKNLMAHYGVPLQMEGVLS